MKTITTEQFEVNKVSIISNVKLDVRSEKCPYPRIRALQELESLKKGDILEVVASDPEAWQNIDAWLTKSGDELISVDTKEGTYHILIRKG